MRDRLLLDRILEPGALSVVFQPVVEEPGRGVHYLEALIRGPQGTSAESPDVLFEYARRKHATASVDRACVGAILADARRLPASVRLGLNVHASTLALDLEFLNYLGDAASINGIDPERLIVEIVEHAPPWDVKAFRAGLDGLRAIGARIALDDVGLGHSNFMMILECRPHYFKIDSYFVRGSHVDFYRQAVLASVARLAQPFGAQVVAEGVESRGDLAAVHEAGIGLVQGFLLSPARPVADFAALEPEAWGD